MGSKKEEGVRERTIAFSLSLSTAFIATQFFALSLVIIRSGLKTLAIVLGTKTKGIPVASKTTARSVFVKGKMDGRSRLGTRC